MQLGVVPFGTALLSLSATQEPVLGAARPGRAEPRHRRRCAAPWRPSAPCSRRRCASATASSCWRSTPTRRRWCSATSPSPAWPTWPGAACAPPARRSPTWSRRWAACRCSTGFAEIVANMKSGNIECAITGTMSGNTIGLHEVTTHIHTMAVNWGLSVFGGQQRPRGRRCPPSCAALLQQELPQAGAGDLGRSRARDRRRHRLQRPAAPPAASGTPGKLTEVQATPADDERRREIFAGTVLRAGCSAAAPLCADVWNRHHRAGGRAWQAPGADVADAMRACTVRVAAVGDLRASWRCSSRPSSPPRRCLVAAQRARRHRRERGQRAERFVSGAEAALNRTLLGVDVMLAGIETLLRPTARPRRPAGRRRRQPRCCSQRAPQPAGARPGMLRRRRHACWPPRSADSQRMGVRRCRARIRRATCWRRPRRSWRSARRWSTSPPPSASLYFARPLRLRRRAPRGGGGRGAGVAARHAAGAGGRDPRPASSTLERDDGQLLASVPADERADGPAAGARRSTRARPPARASARRAGWAARRRSSSRARRCTARC